MLHFVYEEIDPRTDIPKYVGITTNPNGRHGQHLGDSGSNSRKVAWIQELSNAGLQPKMRIIEVVYDRVTAQKREKYWIETYESQGILLTNIVHSQMGKEKPQTQVTPLPRLLSKDDRYAYETLEREWREDNLTKDDTLPFREFACLIHIYITCCCSFGNNPNPEQKNSLHAWMVQRIEDYPQGDRQEKEDLQDEMVYIIYYDELRMAS